jgi:hypothetical protein
LNSNRQQRRQPELLPMGGRVATVTRPWYPRPQAARLSPSEAAQPSVAIYSRAPPVSSEPQVSGPEDERQRVGHERRLPTGNVRSGY